MTSSNRAVYTVFISTLLLVLIVAAQVSAKRGCSSYGHSCFGGHGKRSNSEVENSILKDNGVFKQTLQKYEVPVINGAVMTLDTSQNLKNPLHFDEQSLLPILVRKWIIVHQRTNNAILDADK